MRYREVIRVTKQEFEGAYFREREKGFGETMGTRLGKDIAKRVGYSDESNFLGERVYSLEVVAFSLREWDRILRALELYMPENGMLEKIIDSEL